MKLMIKRNLKESKSELEKYGKAFLQLSIIVTS